MKLRHRQGCRCCGGTGNIEIVLQDCGFGVRGYLYPGSLTLTQGPTTVATIPITAYGQATIFTGIPAGNYVATYSGHGYQTTSASVTSTPGMTALVNMYPAILPDWTCQTHCFGAAFPPTLYLDDATAGVYGIPLDLNVPRTSWVNRPYFHSLVSTTFGVPGWYLDNVRISDSCDRPLLISGTVSGHTVTIYEGP